MSARTKLTVFYLVAIAALLILLVIDVMFVHPHYHWWYHETPAMEIVMGLAGALLLMLVSLALGEALLWKTTCSMLLEPEMVGPGNETATVKRWLVDTEEAVKAGQPLAILETDRGSPNTLKSPHDGEVSKIFIEEDGVAILGETLIDLTVSKHAMGHGEKEADHA